MIYLENIVIRNSYHFFKAPRLLVLRGFKLTEINKKGCFPGMW